VEVRYPGDFPDVLPGDEVRAIALVEHARNVAMAALAEFLATDDPPSPPGQT